MPVNVLLSKLRPDEANPRKPDPARLALLALSLRKLGFIMPMFATKAGMILSGHQRLTVAATLELKRVPVEYVDLKQEDLKGVNILFNRGTADWTAFDTGSTGAARLSYPTVVAAAEALPDCEGEDWYALRVRERSVNRLGINLAAQYDKKATVLADSIIRIGVRIPVVVSESGRMVNGIHRLHAAKERGISNWPVIEIPDHLADVAANFLNYLSMDFHVGEEFADLLRYSAYRRPQNNRGAVAKAYRYWANGERTLPDKDSYSRNYWRHFRDIHGDCIIDFGAGMGKVAPFLRGKGIDCIDFEPYRINPEVSISKPDPEYSKDRARQFLDEIAARPKITSIFLASVLNSIPFPTDRMEVLCIVHALCGRDTTVYGTCRDISDFVYEYGGIRNANYFVFDSEPGVRVGDVMRNPKLQKFMTTEEADVMFKRLWNTTQYWPGGNVFYWRVQAPKGVNTKVLKQALAHEFNLPYEDGTRMGLVDYAHKVFAKRLGVKQL
jgi:ParB-like chromosome segregation protein Spo0J